MLDREQLFRDVTAPSAPFVTDDLQDLYLTRTGVRQGDNLGPGLFRRSYDAATQEWNEQLDARPWARRLVVRYIPMGQTEASIDLSPSGYADDLARAAVAKNLAELGQINREQTDSLRSCTEKPFSPAPSYERDCSSTCCGPQFYEGLTSGLHWQHGHAEAECRARCQAAEASFALFAPFFRSQAPQRFKVLVFKAAIVGHPVGSTRDSASRRL